MELTGYDLTLEEVAAVALAGETVSLAPQALYRMKEAHNLVLKMIEGETLVYGLNTGVGRNKDRRISQKELQDFNRQLIYAHCVGIEPELPQEVVRATMLIHLNGLVKGYAGVQVAIAELLVQFLNLGITPVVNGKGSVGQGDIGILSYIGLAMLGEGLSDFQGKRYETAQLFQHFNLKPVKLYGKDSLGIISSNAVSFGQLSLLLPRLVELVQWFDLSYGLSLEALDGNTSPLDLDVVAAKRLLGHQKSAKVIQTALVGSYLYQKDSQTVQDPLSYRNVTMIHGAVYDSISYVERHLLTEWVSSTDNPMVDVANQRIISTPHFETISISLALEMLNASLSHLSRASVQRIIKLGNPEFTNLPRFLLADEQQYFGLQALQKTAATLDIEIHQASHMMSNVSYPLAGDMEDRQTNLPLLIQQSEQILNKLQELLAIELLYATQGITLRFAGAKPLGKVTKRVYQALEGRYGLIKDHHQVYQNIHQVTDCIRQTSIQELFEYK